MTILDNLFMVIGVFGSLVLSIYFLSRYHYLIKKAYAEHRYDPSVAGRRLSFRDIGIILLSVGIGLGFSSLYTEMDFSEDTTDLLVYATILICGGGGMIAANFFRSEAGE
ncbi:MAG: hypothetical protein AAF587_17920 [Bacteroidota bacterium]